MGVVLDRQAGARIVSLGESGMDLQRRLGRRRFREKNSFVALSRIDSRTSAVIHWDETN